jgi:ribosome-associated protein
MKLKKSDSLALAKLCYQALDEKKAADLRVLDVSEQSSITDFLVLATGTSEPHLRALRIEVEKVLDLAKAKIVGMEIPQESGWMVIDAFDVMVHIFTAEQRERYGLENLWKDAREISANAPAKKSAKKKTSKINPAKKSAARSGKASSKTKKKPRAS